MSFSTASGSYDRQMPRNLEAEHALLGILLYDNGAHRQILDVLTPDDFSEPYHQRLYALAISWIAEGRLANPELLQGALSGDPAFSEFGGSDFLFHLYEKAPPTNQARDFAAEIADTALRRRLIGMAMDAAASARDMATPAYEAVAKARAELEAAERGSAPEDALFVNSYAAAQEQMERLELEVATGLPKGIQTGLHCIDRRLGGLMPGSVIVLAGRPGMGKTALLGNILYGAARLNPERLFAGFSLEMDTDQLQARALSRLTAEEDQPVRFSDIAKVLPLTPMDLDMLHRVKQRMPANLWLRDKAGVSVSDVERLVWSMKRKGPLAAIGIDYLQLMRRPALAGRNEASALGEMTGGLKTLARDAKIAIVLLSQLSRQVESREDKRPQLSDLRESGSIEQDADAVIFPFREVYYLQKAEPRPNTPEHRDWEIRIEDMRRRMDVIVGKNRHGSEGVERQTYSAEVDLVTNEPEAQR